MSPAFGEEHLRRVADAQLATADVQVACSLLPAILEGCPIDSKLAAGTPVGEANPPNRVVDRVAL